MKRLIYFLNILSFAAGAMEHKDAAHAAYLDDYRKVITIKNTIIDLAESIKKENVAKAVSIDLRRPECCKPDESQTSQGFFLEMRNNIPKAILWQLGHYEFVFASSVIGHGDELLLAKIIDTFGAREFGYKELKPLGVEKSLLQATIYRLTKIGGQALPEAQFKDAKDYVSPSGAKEIYKKLATA